MEIGGFMAFVYLVRHGQTAWNKSEIFRGRADVPLNERGLKEAELAAEYFRGRKVDAIYSSPISRAVQTAEKIAGVLGLKVRMHSGITDMSFGDWEGRPVHYVLPAHVVDEEEDDIGRRRSRETLRHESQPGGGGNA